MTAGVPILIVMAPSGSGAFREVLFIGPEEGTTEVQRMDDISTQRQPASKTARF